MLTMKFITENGLKIVKTLEYPNPSPSPSPSPSSSSSSSPIPTTNNNEIGVSLGEDELQILQNTSMYTTIDITDPYNIPSLEGETYDTNILNDVGVKCEGVECKILEERSKSYCQRPWYKCDSELPVYGYNYYYSSNKV
jgi:hypothetical protein